VQAVGPEVLAQLRIWATSRYGLLLASLSLIMALGPPLAEIGGGEILIAAISTVLMLSCAVAVGHMPTTRRRLLGFSIVVIAADVALSVFHPARPVSVAAGGLRAAFLLFVTLAVLTHVVRTERVTHDTIIGGICVYLLIGLFFHSVFGIIELLHPGSFQNGGVAVSELPGADRVHGRYPILVYYSLVWWRAWSA
jgi:hypothetical protein